MEKQKYEALVDGKMPIESHLHKHLAEHLNSEIALGTINNLEVAMHWMRSTYFYVRSMQNPSFYGLDENMDKDIIENKLEKICLVHIQDLHNAGLITRNPENELDVETTSYGKLMAKYYLCFETMKLFRQIRGDETFLKIFELVVRCREFSEFTLRVNEKRILNALNETPLRFPRAGRIKTREDKISCLLQAVLGNITIASATLAQESLKMIRIADRIAKCLLEYMRLSEQQKQQHQVQTFNLGRYKALLHTVTIAKCFNSKLWENSEYAVKQLQKIGAVYSAQLVSAGKTTLKSLGATDARTIEAILNKSYPFGDEILKNLQQTFPEYVCTLQLAHDSQSMLQISVRQVNEAFIYRGTNAMIIVGDSSNQLLLFIEDLDALLVEYGVFLKTIKLPNPDVEKVYAHVIHATLVGVDVHETLVLKKSFEESITEPHNTKSKKRKQKTVAEKIRSKKAKSKTCDESEEDSVQRKKNATIQNLQKFKFSKSTILNDSTISALAKDPLVEINNSTYTELTDTGITDNEAFPCNTTATNQSNNNSALVQTKLTNFFKQKKYNTDKTFSTTKTLSTSMLTKQRDLEFDRLKASQVNGKKEGGDALPNSTPQATTPDLHEISAFLESQKSVEKCETSHRSMLTVVGSQSDVCAIPSSQATKNAIPNGTQTSTIFYTPKSKENIYENTHISKTPPKVATENYMEPLNLTRKRKLSYIDREEEQVVAKKNCSPFNGQDLINSNYEYIKSSTRNSPVMPTTSSKQNNNHFVLDFSSSSKATNNLNTCWRSDSAGMRDDVSVMSVALTHKSSEYLADSPKNVENFLLCYKTALAFMRLKSEERNIANFQKIYQRIWHTNEAIDYITAKLNNSGISRNEKEKTVITSQSNALMHDQQATCSKRREMPLNLTKISEVGKCISNKENKIPSDVKSTAQLNRPRFSHVLKERSCGRQTNEVTKAESTNSLRNPYRLQILSDMKKTLRKTKCINNEVMNMVLNMKCQPVGLSSDRSNKAENEPVSLASVEIAEIEREIEREIELNDKEDMPHMSFEEYYSHFLRIQSKK